MSEADGVYSRGRAALAREDSSTERRHLASSKSQRAATAKNALKNGRSQQRHRFVQQRSAHLFFQLIARRYEKGSMLITTNQLVSQWGGVFRDDVLAATILDRLLHHSHTLVIQRERYRLRQKRKAGLLSRGPERT